MALQLDLHIMPARGVTSSLVRGKDDTNALPTLALVQGDIGVARLRFYSEDRTLGTVTQLDRGTDSFVFTGRLSSNLEAEKLFEADSFTRVDGGAGDIYYEGALTLSTEPITAALAGKTEVPILCEVESAGPGSLARFPATLYREIARTGPAPAAIPSYPAPSQLATKADLDALRGGVPLTGWANSTAYPFGTCTITGGIPSALEFAGVTDDFAYAELALTDFAPDTLDISGTVSAGTVELADLSLVFLDGAGTEAGTIGALTIGAAFSFASVVVPYGAVKVAVKALGTAATSSLSTGFSALSVTAHATLSELTAEALAAILAAKAQAEADAGTIAAARSEAEASAAAALSASQEAEGNASAIPAAFVAATQPTYSALSVSLGVTDVTSLDDSTIFKGWGSKFNKAGVSFNAVRILQLKRRAVSAAADKWATLHVEVRDCSAGGNGGLGAVIATGSVSVDPELPELADVLIPLKSASTGEYVTLDDSALTAPYFIGVIAKNSSGTAAVMGRPRGTVTNFEGNSFYSTNARSWDNDSADLCHAFELVSLSGLVDAFVLNRIKADRAALPAPKFALPPVAYAVVGREFNLYHGNIVETTASLAFDYHTSLGGAETALAKHQNERLTYTPATAGTPIVNVVAFERDSWRKVAGGTVTLNVASADTAFTRKLLVIGDSTTADGAVTAELLALDTADANTSLTLVGTQGSGSNRHEGLGGWTVKRWHAPAGGDVVLNKFSNAGAVFDFGYYLANTSQTMASGDHVIINLGINDVFSFIGDRSVEALCDDAFARIEAMITSIRTSVPGIRVGVAVTIPPSAEQDAFGANYYAGQGLARYRRNNLIWSSALIAQFKGRTASGIYLVPINLGLDTVNNMRRATAAAVNSRNTAVQVARQNNGVHPAVSGYAQIADQIWAYLKSLA